MICTLTNLKSLFLSKKKESAYNRTLVWVYVVSESLGIGCMALFAAFPNHYGVHNNGAVTGGARPIVVEAAEGRLHNGAWKGGKHSHTTYPRRFTYNILYNYHILYIEIRKSWILNP